jgi:hypothetical protein
MVEGDLVRVAVVVADPRRDERRAGAGGVQQRRVGAGMRAVVADLEHVDPCQEAAFREQALDRHLRVTGEEGREAAEAQQADDRRVVDIGVRERASHVRRGRVENRQGCGCVEAQPLTCARGREAPSWLGTRGLEESWIGGVLVGTSAIQDQPHSVALQGRHQAGDVVLVRVGEDYHVDAPPPPGQPLAEASQEQIGIGPAVDEHRGARWRGHQDRVALPDVQGYQVQAAVRQADQRQGDEQRAGSG